MTAIQPLKCVQVLLPSESYQILQRLAAQEKQPISALVRHAVEEHLIKETRLATVRNQLGGLARSETGQSTKLITDKHLAMKAKALARLAAMDLPVDDWAIMEVEIMDGRYRGHT